MFSKTEKNGSQLEDLALKPILKIQWTFIFKTWDNDELVDLNTGEVQRQFRFNSVACIMNVMERKTNQPAVLPALHQQNALGSPLISHLK